MRNPVRDVMAMTATAALVAGFLYAAPSQAPAFRAARLEGMPYPDLNGIWQAMNTAHWDLEGHVARPRIGNRPWPGWRRPRSSGPCARRHRRCARRSWRCRGRTIPYQASAAAQKQENFENALARDPRGQVFPARYSARHVYALSLADCSKHGPDSNDLRVCGRQPGRSTWKTSVRRLPRPGWGTRLVAGRGIPWWSM